MAETDYDEVVKRIDCLSEDQLRRVRDRIDMKLGSGSGKASGPDQSWEWFLERLVNECRTLQICQLPYKQVRPQSFIQHNLQKLTTTAQWLESTTADKLERIAVTDLALRLLYQDLCEGIPTRWNDEEQRLIRTPGRTVSVREMVIFCDRIPAVLDNSFPGYARYGLLGSITKLKGGTPDVR